MRAAAILLPLALIACGKPADAPTSVPTVAPITLPADPVILPATPAGELVTINCTACHSPDMLTAQPAMPAEKWAATVKKMREVYHAPIAPADDAAIVRALVETQGAAKRN